MKMFKRVFAFLCVICIGFATGTSLTVLYAHHHRVAGVDYPLDPPNYYSKESVSVPDSKPSHFALKDLAANAGSVYDFTRHIKSILEDNQFIAWYLENVTKWGIIEHENAQLPDATKQSNMEDYQRLVSSINDTKSNVDIEPDAFDYKWDEGEPTRQPDYADQKQALDKGYREIYEASAKRDAMAYNFQPAIDAALEQSNNAEGRMQAQQAGAQLTALKNLAIGGLTQAMGDSAKIEYLHQLQDQADSTNQFIQQKNGSYHFYDPYHNESDKKMMENYYRVSGQTPYESEGMPDFQ